MEQQVYLSPSDISAVIKLSEHARIKSAQNFEIATISFQKGDSTFGVHLSYNSKKQELHMNWYRDNAGDAVVYPIVDGVVNQACQEFNARCAAYWNEYTQYQITDLLENQ